jgi:hypothetical protein
VGLYFASISEACSSRSLFFSVVAMLCQCVLNNRLEAHKIAHELHSQKTVDLASISKLLEKDFKPLAEAVSSIVQPQEQLLIQF